MKRYRKIIGGLFILAIFGVGIAYIITEPIKFGICQSTYLYEWRGSNFVGCLDKIAESIGQPLGLFSLSYYNLPRPILPPQRSISYMGNIFRKLVYTTIRFSYLPRTVRLWRRFWYYGRMFG